MDHSATSLVAPGLGGPPKAPPLHKLACLNHQPLHDARKGADGELEHYHLNNSTFFMQEDTPTQRLRQQRPQLNQRRPQKNHPVIPPSNNQKTKSSTAERMMADPQLPQPHRRRSDQEVRPTHWSRSPLRTSTVREVSMFSHIILQKAD